MNYRSISLKLSFLTLGLALTGLAGCGQSSEAETDGNDQNIVNAGTVINTTSIPPGLFLNGFFPIGAYSVPSSDFSKWKSRGVNTLVNDVGDTDGERLQWNQAAVAAGFKLIRPPLPNPADDIGNSALLAWSQMDEPDIWDKGEENLPELQQNYKKWKQIDPTRLVFLNFSGGDVMRTNQPDVINTDVTYKNMIATADWIANDIYPLSGYLFEDERRTDLTLLSEPIDQLRSWAPLKPQFCFIESAKIYSEFRGIKPAELRAQIWLAMVHGVRGLFFFSHIFENDDWLDWDGTQKDVAAEMTIQTSLITSIALALQGDINPTSMHVVVPKGLEAGWRNSSLGKFVFVVNPTSQTYSNQTITLTGTSASTTAAVIGESRTISITDEGTHMSDHFPGFAVHIYQLQ